VGPTPLRGRSEKQQQTRISKERMKVNSAADEASRGEGAQNNISDDGGPYLSTEKKNKKSRSKIRKDSLEIAEQVKVGGGQVGGARYRSVDD